MANALFSLASGYLICTMRAVTFYSPEGQVGVCGEIEALRPVITDNVGWGDSWGTFLAPL